MAKRLLWLCSFNNVQCKIEHFEGCRGYVASDIYSQLVQAGKGRQFYAWVAIFKQNQILLQLNIQRWLLNSPLDQFCCECGGRFASQLRCAQQVIGSQPPKVFSCMQVTGFTHTVNIWSMSTKNFRHACSLRTLSVKQPPSPHPPSLQPCFFNGKNQDV